MFLSPHTIYLLRYFFLIILLWSGSLWGYDLPRHVKWPKGFVDAEIFQLELDAKSNVWVLTNKGLLVMDGYNLLPVYLSDFPFRDCENANPNKMPSKMKVVHDKLYLFYESCGLTVLKWPYLRQETVFDNGVADVLGLEEGGELVLFESGKLIKYFQTKEVELRNFGNVVDAELKHMQGGKILLTLKNQAVHQFLLGFKGLDNVFSLPAAKPLLGNLFAEGVNKLVFENESYLLDDIFTFQSKVQHDKPLLYWDFISDIRAVIMQNHPAILQLVEGADTLHLPVPGRVKQVQFVNKNLFYVACTKELIVYKKQEKVSTVYNDDHLFEEGYQRVRRKVIVLDSQQIMLLGYPKLVKATLGNNGEITRLQLQETNKGTSFSGQLYSIYNAVVLGKKLYCVAEGKGLMHIDLDLFQVHKYKNTHLDSKGFYYAIAVKDSQTLLIGANQSVVSYHINTNQSKSFKLKGLGVYDNIYDILPLANGEILLATSNGLYLYDHTLRNLLWSYRDPKGDLNNLFRAVVEQKTAHFHYIWAASHRGAIVFDRHTKRLVKVFDKNSLHVNFRPTTFIVDTNQNMWVSSFQGVLGINPNTWQTIWLKNKIDLANQEFNYQSGALLPNGRLFFGGITTYESLDPMLLYNPKPLPKISLTAYMVEEEKGETVHLIDEVAMPKNIYLKLPSYKLVLFFSDKQHQANFPFTFKYKIGNGPWVLASNTSSLIFSNLPYGKHLVEIGFLDALNQEMIQRFNFNLHIQEKFYKTTYFLALMYFGIALLVLVVYVVVKNNINIKRRTLKLVFLDLKGELSTYIEEAQVLTSQAIQENKQPIQPDLMPSVALDIKEARTFLNFYIASLTQGKVTLEELKSDLMDFLNKQFENAVMVFALEFEVENNQDLEPNLVKDIKLCVFEICNNVLKHAEATTVHIQLIFTKKTVTIIAVDNGKLKNVNDLYNKGNGVLNLQKRAQRNSGFALFGINSKLGHGLKINIQLDKK